MSKISICNEALGQILVDPITDLDEKTSKPALYCNLYYESCVKTLLRLFPFNFSIKKVQVAVVSDISKYDWTYVYLYPSDCIYLLEVTATPSKNAVGDPSNSNGIFYSKTLKDSELFDIGRSSDSNKKIIYSNVKNAYIVYTSYIEDTTLYDPLFRECLVYMLASKLSYSLAGDKKLIDRIDQKFAYTLTMAKDVNAQEGNTLVPQSNSYIKARRR